MRATLWDGVKQINGSLEFLDEKLVFDLEDFAETSLSLQIPYSEITSLSFKRIFKIENAAIQITSADGKENLFVMDDGGKTMNKLKSVINSR